MKAAYNGRAIPSDGQAIQYVGGKFVIPDRPIIPFIEGDGTGRDIWKASQRVFDAAVELVYGGKRKIAWYEVFAGEKAFNEFKQWLPDETVEAVRDFRISIKGPLTTPVGGGIRSLNVALRQILDLYACVRPVRYFQGVASPVKHPERMDVVIYRENTEDVYIGIEWKSGTPEVKKLLDFLNKEMLGGGPKQIRADSGCGHQADVPVRHEAADAARDSIRARQQEARRDHHAQGQHPEIYRRRVPRLGLRTGRRRISRPDRHRARELDPRQSRQGSATLRSSRTPRLSSRDSNRLPTHSANPCTTK